MRRRVSASFQSSLDGFLPLYIALRARGMRADHKPARHDGAMDTAAPNPKWIKGETDYWEVVIGLEVHAQVASESKLFSGASAEFGGEPNSHVSFVDAAMPG